MKGVLENIQHYCIHDGPGIRTVVFLKGCPLRCRWCSNPTTQEHKPELLYHADKCFSCGHCAEICPQRAVTREGEAVIFDRALCDGCGLCAKECPGKALQIAGVERNTADVLEDIKKDMAFYRNSGGGVTLSGGEVLAQAAFALDLMAACKRYGIHLALETSGFGKREDLLALVDAADCLFYDVKHADDDVHRELTGQGCGLILDNLDAVLDRAAGKLTVRLPLIPGLNDDEGHLENFARTIKALGRVAFEMRLTPKAPFPENIIPGKTHAVLRRRTFQYLQALCSPELPTVFTVIHKGPRHADFPNRTAQKAVFYPCSRRLS